MSWAGAGRRWRRLRQHPGPRMTIEAGHTQAAQGHWALRLAAGLLQAYTMGAGRLITWCHSSQSALLVPHRQCGLYLNGRLLMGWL